MATKVQGKSPKEIPARTGRQVSITQFAEHYGVHRRTVLVNTERTASARSAKRRSQPRTVSAGRAKSVAIRRNPARLVAFAASADTITAAVSARRSNPVTGNNTCVTPQPVHRERRGHSSTSPSGPGRATAAA